MKKTKPIVTKSVVTAVISSLLGSSCLMNDYNLEDNIYGEYASNNTDGIPLIDIEKSNLSNEFVKKLKGISVIINEILESRIVAKEFSENPSDYLAKKELSFNLKLSEQEKTTLKAFADDEIMTAVKRNDINSFICIAKEKGYIGVVRPNQEDIRAMFRTDEDYQQFINNIHNNNGGITTYEESLVIVAVALAGIYAVAETMAGIQIGAVYHTGFWTEAGGESSSSLEEKNISTLKAREPVLKIWTDNNDSIILDNVYTEMIEKPANQLTRIVLQHFPDLDKNYLRKILKTNLESYYGLRK